MRLSPHRVIAVVNGGQLGLLGRTLAARFSWPVVSITSLRLVESLKRQGISPSTVIDVGANVGQFAVAAGKLLRPAAIYSFEPLPEAFKRLRGNLSKLRNAVAHQLALGDMTGTVNFTVNSYSHSSSVLPLADAHRVAFPEARETSVVHVAMTTLDAFFGHTSLAEPVLLKLDVQGFEARVLAGGEEFLTRTRWVVAETSFRPMYQGEELFIKLVERMRERGFQFLRPVGWLAEPRTGEILQADALFERES